MYLGVLFIWNYQTIIYKYLTNTLISYIILTTHDSPILYNSNNNSLNI